MTLTLQLTDREAAVVQEIRVAGRFETREDVAYAALFQYALHWDIDPGPEFGPRSAQPSLFDGEEARQP